MKKIKNSFLLIFIILIAIFMAIIIGSFVFFYTTFENSGKISSGVFIKGVNVSRNDQKRSKKSCK